MGVNFSRIAAILAAVKLAFRCRLRWPPAIRFLRASICCRLLRAEQHSIQPTTAWAQIFPFQ